MEAFFAISGFLMARLQVAGRYSIGRRLEQLLVPTFAVWLFVLPFTIDVKGGSFTFANPYHLWFLLVLSIITPLGYMLDESGLSGWINAKIKAYPKYFLLGVVVLATGNAQLSRGILYLLQWEQILPTIAVLTPYYAVFYLAGFFVSRQEGLCAWMSSTRWAWVGVFALLGAMCWYNAVYYMVADPSASAAFKVLRTFIMSLVAVLMSFTVLATALRVQENNDLVRRLSQSGFSVYLFHVPVLGILFYLLSTQVTNPVFLFTILTVGSFSISWMVHEFIVSKFALTLWLFNGKAFPWTSIFSSSPAFSFAPSGSSPSTRPSPTTASSSDVSPGSLPVGGAVPS
jgi:peptidoglycan/LPS O-acetylase OafA/YrhL